MRETDGVGIAAASGRAQAEILEMAAAAVMAGGYLPDMAGGRDGVSRDRRHSRPRCGQTDHGLDVDGHVLDRAYRCSLHGGLLAFSSGVRPRRYGAYESILLLRVIAHARAGDFEYYLRRDGRPNAPSAARLPPSSQRVIRTSVRPQQVPAHNQGLLAQMTAGARFWPRRPPAAFW